MTKALEIFSKRLNLFMVDKQWNQNQLEEATGIKRSQLSRYIRGKTPPNLETIEKIAHALGRSVADFFKEEITFSSSPKEILPAQYQSLWEKIDSSDREVITNIFAEYIQKDRRQKQES